MAIKSPRRTPGAHELHGPSRHRDPQTITLRTVGMRLLRSMRRHKTQLEIGAGATVLAASLAATGAGVLHMMEDVTRSAAAVASAGFSGEAPTAHPPVEHHSPYGLLASIGGAGIAAGGFMLIAGLSRRQPEIENDWDSAYRLSFSDSQGHFVRARGVIALDNMLSKPYDPSALERAEYWSVDRLADGIELGAQAGRAAVRATASVRQLAANLTA